MYNQYNFYGVNAITETALCIVLSLQTLSFVFYVYRPKQVKMPKALALYCRISVENLFS